MGAGGAGGSSSSFSFILILCVTPSTGGGISSFVVLFLQSMTYAGITGVKSLGSSSDTLSLVKDLWQPFNPPP